MLFHSIKQCVIILLTSFFPFNSLALLFLQQACFMLFTYFMFLFCWYERGLLNFVSERIKLVYRINNTRLAFQTSKTTIYRPHTPELKSISKFQLFFLWRNFEKYMIFYTPPWSGWNRTHKLWNTYVVPFSIAELGQKCLEAAPTLKYGPLNSSITVLSASIIKIFQYYASKHL